MMTMMWDPSIKDDLYRWVMLTYPWGKKNTQLEKAKGPRAWQKRELDAISAHIAENKAKMARGEDPEIYRLAVVSGRGPGKSALVAWITHWFLSTVLGGTAILSANTDTQLTDKTYAELGKWLTFGMNGYWFDRVTKKITPKKWFAEEVAKARLIDNTYYYAQGVLWNEDEPDSFAGAHNPLGMLLIFDEASGIPQPIWTVSSGFFTDISAYRFWLVFSNPRSNTGPFYDCFHEKRDMWHTTHVDARAVETNTGIDQKIYEDIIREHGIDSDQARIEVLGEFPSRGDRQFIARGVVKDAQGRELERYDDHAALLMGVDPARYGEDATVIRFRRGRDARSYPVIEMRKKSNMEVANECARLIDAHHPDAVFVDSGAGAGIIDRLREVGYKIHEVGFGTESSDPHWADHRTELWARMREWLIGAMIDSNKKLEDDLVRPQYEFTGREDKIKLESKDKMKKRDDDKKSSTDHADALAVTFHCKVARSDMATSRLRGRNPGRKNPIAKGRDYDVFGR